MGPRKRRSTRRKNIVAVEGRPQLMRTEGQMRRERSGERRNTKSMTERVRKEERRQEEKEEQGGQGHVTSGGRDRQLSIRRSGLWIFCWVLKIISNLQTASVSQLDHKPPPPINYS